MNDTPLAELYKTIEELENKYDTLRPRFDNLFFLLAEQEEILINLRDTINFYSDELPATLENQTFFESLVEHYEKIKDNKKFIAREFEFMWE